MKKIFFLIIIVTLYFYSCKSNYTKVGDKNQNYVPYYLSVDKAKKAYDKGEHEKTFFLLDSLFNHYEPIQTLFINELDIYCELALKFKNKKKVKKIMYILVDEYGSNLSNYNNKFWPELKQFSGISDKKLKEKFNKFNSNINYNVRDSLTQMLFYDQKYRIEKNIVKTDSIDKENEKKLRFIFKKYGYPTQKLIGGHIEGNEYKLSTLSVLLKHISLSFFNEIQPFLLDELKKGKCPPVIYGGMVDHKIVVDSDIIPFTYYATYRNVPPTDKKATNEARLKIGLPAIE